MKLTKIMLTEPVHVAPRVASEVTLEAHSERKMGVDLDLELVGDIVVIRPKGHPPVGVPMTNVRGMWFEDEVDLGSGEPMASEPAETYTDAPAHAKRKPVRPKGSRNKRKGR